MPTTPHLRATDDVALVQTNTTLVAAPGAGKKIVVTAIYLSADTAMRVDLESNGAASPSWSQFVGANGGSVTSGRGEVFSCGTNESLTWSSGLAGNVFIAVNYRVEDA